MNVTLLLSFMKRTVKYLFYIYELSPFLNVSDQVTTYSHRCEQIVHGLSCTTSVLCN